MSKRLAWLLTLTMGAALPAAAQQAQPVTWRASIAPSSIHPGEDGIVRIEGSIDEGWHIYSASQPDGGPLATEVSLIDPSPFRVAGKVRQGDFERKYDEAFAMEVEAFSRNARFEIPVTVPSGARPGVAEARVRVFYQACSGKLCLVPAEKVLTARVRIVPAPVPAAAVAARPKEAPSVSNAARGGTKTAVAKKPAPSPKPAESAARVEQKASAQPAEEGCPTWRSLREAYQHLSVVRREDRDRHPAVLDCAVEFLEGLDPDGEEAYYAALIRLRPRKDADLDGEMEQAAALLRKYLDGSEPLYFEESALANLTAAQARVHRLDEAIETYDRLKKTVPRESSTHDQWTDSTNVEHATGTLLRELAHADRWEEVERIARSHVDHMSNGEVMAAMRLGSTTSWLLEALEERRDDEGAAIARENLKEHFVKHLEKYPASAEMWLASRRIQKLEMEEGKPADALRVAQAAREHYVRMGTPHTIDATIQRLQLFDRAAPAFEAEEWINSVPLSLDQLRGKVVLLDFWQTWCAPCRDAFPKLEEMSRAHSADGLVVIGVTQSDGFVRTKTGETIRADGGGSLPFEQELEHLGEFVKDFELTMPIAVTRRPVDPDNRFATAAFQQRYGIGYFPTTVLIDREGVLRYIGGGEGESYESILKRLLTGSLPRAEDAAGSSD